MVLKCKSAIAFGVQLNIKEFVSNMWEKLASLDLETTGRLYEGKSNFN